MADTSEAFRASARDLRTGAALLALIALAATLGAAIWPHSPTATLEPAVAGLARPGARFVTLELDDGRRLAASTIVARGSEFLLRDARGERRLTLAATATHGSKQPVRSVRFWLGSDRFGRDLAARLLHGGRLSLAVAFGAVAVALGFGVPFGLACGLASGRMATATLALLDGAQAFPRLFLIVALAAVARPSALTAAIVLGATGWMPLARLVRAETRRLRAVDFIAAARLSGASRTAIALRHLLPNLWAPIAVEASLGLASAVAAEAALSFLGLGAPPPAPSWGGLIAEGRDLLATAPWISIAPGLALAATVLGANLVAEGARRHFEPRRAELPG